MKIMLGAVILAMLIIVAMTIVAGLKPHPDYNSPVSIEDNI